MQKTESQISGHLYRKSNTDSSWSNRFVILSTDTGSMKFYAEKSGKKTMKNQVNVRKSKFIPLDQEKAGKPFAFELNTEELAGKTEDGVMILAAIDQSQYDSWKEGIELCFTIGGEARRRKSSIISGPVSIDPVPQADQAVSDSSETEQATEEDLEKEKKLNAAKMLGTALPMITPEMLQLKKRISLSAEQKVPFASSTPNDSESTELGSPPLSIVPPPFEETNSIKSVISPPPTNPVTDTADAELQSVTNDETPLSKPNSRSQTPNSLSRPAATPASEGRKSVTLADTPISELTDEQKELLERRGSRKSFKVPTNLGNLLNKNGLDPSKEEAIKEEKTKAKEQTIEDTASPAPSAKVQSTPSKPSKPKPPREIKLSVRPTEPQRTGVLERFDMSRRDEGEDAWVMMEVDLDIATGLVQTYSNIGGRRILRTKYNTRELHAVPMDSVYFGKLFAFRFTRDKDSEDENDYVAVFAADDQEAYSYWMVSFEDVKDQVDQERKKEEEEMKAKLEAEEAERKRKQEEDQRIEAERLKILENKRKEAEFAEKVRQQAEEDVRNRMAAAATTETAQEKPKPKKKLSIKEKLAAQFAAKAAGLPMPTFEDEEEDDSSQPASESKSIDTINRVGSTSFVGPVVKVTDENVDDMLKVGSVASGESDVGHVYAAPIPPPPPVDPRLALIEKLEFKVNRTTYPADRLSRRVKIWYCSSGFSLSSVEEIQQFVQELKNTGDHTLEAFADEKFDKINDWANLLEVLRKYEQRLLIDMPPLNVDDNDVIKVEVEVLLPEEQKKMNFVVNEHFSIDDLSKRIAEEYQFNELAVTARMPAMILKSAGNPWTKSFQFLQEELTFAEDLVLYQEEVIEHMWESHSALKALIEQKDEVINQLYNQLSELQDKVRFMQTTTEFTTPSTSSTTSSVFQSSSTLAGKGLKTIQALADKEFNEADKDGDGRISREEWRKWIQDKHNLIQEHNQVKAALMNEIKTLRKALSPATDQVFQDLKKNEEIRKKQEEEIIQVHIEKDSLKEEVVLLQAKLREMEEEKEMIEYGWKEKYEALAFQKQSESGENKDANDYGMGGIPSSLPLPPHPYAYNYPQDQSLGITTMPDPSQLALSMLQPTSLLGAPTGSIYIPQPPQQSQYGGGDGGDSGIDLLTLASMGDGSNYAGGGGYNNYNPQPQTNYNNQYNNAQQWMQPYQSEAVNLGSSQSSNPYNYPPPALNDSAYNYNNLGGNPYGNTPMTARSQGSQYPNPTPSKSNLQRPPAYPTNNTPARYGSPRANAAPAAPPIAVDQNHPLRNALREEVKHKGAQNYLFAVPSPYSVVKSKGKAATRSKPVVETSVLPGRSDASPSIRESRSNPTSSTPSRLNTQSDIIGGRAHSPNRFMQGTNSWKLKATTDKQAQTGGNVIRTSGGWK